MDGFKSDISLYDDRTRHCYALK